MMTLIKNLHVENNGNGRKRNSTVTTISLNSFNGFQASSDKDMSDSTLDESISINNTEKPQDEKKTENHEFPKENDLYVALKPFLYCMSFFGMYNDSFLFRSKRARIAVTIYGVVVKMFVTANCMHYVVQFATEENTGKSAFNVAMNLRIILMIWLMQNTVIFWTSYQFSSVKKGIPEYFRLMQKYCLKGERPVYLDYIKKVVRVLVPLLFCVLLGSGTFIASSYMVKDKSVKQAFKIIYGVAMYAENGQIVSVLLLIVEASFFILYTCAWVAPMFLLILIIQCTNCELESFDSDFSACFTEDGTFYADIGEFRQRYLNLSDIVENVNGMFQIFISVTLTICLVMLLLMLYIFAIASGGNEGAAVLIFNAFWFLVILAYMTTLIMCADRLATWVMLFYHKVVNDPIGISLLGLINLGRQLLLGITSLLTSFYILALEMSGGERECDCSLMAGVSNNSTNTTLL